MSQAHGHGHSHDQGPPGDHGQGHDHEGMGDLLDLDAGTGTGTFGLVQHFTEAHAWAVDEAEEMLDRLSERAADLDLADRVSTVQANLDEAVPDIEPVDLVWASASFHHLSDPERTLADLAQTVRPGGLMAVVEMSGFPRFVPDDAPGGQAEARAHALLTADRAVDMPTMGSNWGVRLTKAGLTIEMERPIRTDLAAPPDDVVGKYAAGSLARILPRVVDRMEPADRVGLESLLDGGANDVRTRSDLRVSNQRHLWIARRSPANGYSHSA